jgi:phosphatidylglycerophosphate synthase
VRPIIRNERGKIAALPYALTWSRLPLAIAFYFAISSNHPFLALLFLALAGLSDFLDGLCARRYIGPGTPYGPVLDPIMDKIFVIFALLGILRAGAIERYQILFLLSRDIFTAGLTVLCYPWIRKRMQIKSRPLGKAVTTLQFATILTALVVVVFPGTPHGLVKWLSVLTLFVSILAILDYIHTYFRGVPQPWRNPPDCEPLFPRRDPASEGDGETSLRKRLEHR